MPVRLLDSQTIGKIAAGEVIERPVSVVKELIENSIDSGATSIAVELERGGGQLIRVTDDGAGMSAGDLALAIERHATSKLSAFDDLETLQTLGFRGEALPSIGAVSRLGIRSRERSGTVGAELELNFGRQSDVTSGSVPPGTSITVRELFGNVPARLKFLRQPSTESAYVTRLLGAYACLRSDIRWSLTIDGRRSISTPGTANDLDAALGVYGAELNDEILELSPLGEDARVPGIDVSGWVSSPRVTRAHRQNLFFFVNGRLIQHRSMIFALEEAFQSLLLVGRHPIGMVRIAVDQRMVDVNVHPTKAEVKFADDRAVCRAVQRATHQALTRQPQDSIPAVAFLPPGPNGLGMEQGAFTSLPIPPLTPHPAGSRLPEGSPTESPRSINPSGVPALRVLGQVGGTYIIAEGPSGVFMIDQHAAHERVMYEKILGQMTANAVHRQPLLDPLVIELSPEELVAFERSVDELGEIGFDVERFGEQSVVVRQIPAIVRGVDIAERFRLILRELADGGAGDSWIDSVAISAACHTSIRAGQALSLEEMRELVAQLERTEQPRACGHGRPTMLHMSRGDLERQFSRR
ncbi:MAG: DNA mismatch repair endonuclease MutL [Chloroflexia bacterium]|nr:DNA mismatch repair endonuclease MutL [Chloroflexia bacterium]